MLVFVAVMSFVMPVSAQIELKKVYSDDLDRMLQIDEALREANDSGRFVVCQVGGNWCPWCLRFAAFVENDSTVNKVVHDNFVFIHVNYNPSNDKTPEMKAATDDVMTRLGNPRRFGFPVFVVLDGKGNVIHTQDSSFLEEGKGYSQERVLRFFQCWTPKALGR